MKNYTQANTSRSAKQADSDLKKILMADLRAFKIKSRNADAPVIQLNLTSAA